jgi:hypothetical protein
MKRYKDLREKLNEDSESYYDAKYRVGPLGGNNEVDQADAAIFDLARPDNVRRINTYLGAAGVKPVLDPNSVLRQIQKKLSMIGLQFSIPTSDLGGRSRYGTNDVPDGGEGTTTNEYPLSYLGGRFGVLDNSGKIGYDDNISHRLGHGLKLRVVFQDMPNGMTTVVAKVVTADSNGSTELNVPSMMKQAISRMRDALTNNENYTTQMTGMTNIIPKQGAGDDTFKDVEKTDKVVSIVSRLRSITPGQ